MLDPSIDWIEYDERGLPIRKPSRTNWRAELAAKVAASKIVAPLNLPAEVFRAAPALEDLGHKEEVEVEKVEVVVVKKEVKQEVIVVQPVVKPVKPMKAKKSKKEKVVGGQMGFDL